MATSDSDNVIANKNILITGGTGSFGKKFIEIALQECSPNKIIVFSRDEVKQSEMADKFHGPPMRYFIGDVRDRNRLERAFDDVDVVIHAAALKQIPAAEYNPIEPILTNIMGAVNVIDAAINCNVKQIIALSTDKAVNPINLYGATKLCSDKLFVAANSYAGQKKTRFSVVRYGNVMGSRGSVVPLFRERRKTGIIPITDPQMTRFSISLEQGVRFVIKCLSLMHGGEIFVPKLPSVRIVDLADAIAPECKRDIIGVRPGEKIHEVMISADDARHTIEMNDYFIVKPEFPWWDSNSCSQGKELPQEFAYSSNTNKQWLTKDELSKMLAEFDEDE